VYGNSRATADPLLVARSKNVEERLGGSAKMTEPFLEKPKGMHWRTYERLWWEHYEADGDARRNEERARQGGEEA
jgi:hypothetical protein